MKAFFKIFTAVAAASLLVVSCDLDLTPRTAIAYDPDGQLFLADQDVEAFENGILARFRTTLRGDFDLVDDVMYDAFNATVTFGNRHGDVHRSDNSFTSGSSYIEDIWGGYYVAIKDYNNVIEAAKNIGENVDPEYASLVQGEAYFFRAYTYLQLVRRFAKAYSEANKKEPGVPIVLVYNQLEKPSRSSLEDCYKQIKADLDSASVRIAAAATADPNYAGKPLSVVPTVDAVNALYARYYLDIQDYANAAAKAAAVIASPAAYTLANTAALMATVCADDGGAESIFQPAVKVTSEFPNSNSFLTYLSDVPDVGKCYQSDFLPSAKLIAAYEGSDIRFGAWFTNSEYPSRYNGSNYTGDFYVFKKYQGNLALSTVGYPNGYNAPKPLKIGEMYLIAAEAYLAATDATNALLYLNALQTARGTSLTAATADNIHKEWFRETVGDGLRQSCLKRWGEGFAARAGQAGALADNVLMTGAAYDGKTMAATDRALVWPIPAYEKKINDNLVQNPGYEAGSSEAGE